MTPDYDRKRIEIMQARRAATTLPEHEQVLFNSLKNVTRSIVYQDRTFLVWEILDGKNQLLDVLKISDIDVGFHDGLAIRFKNSMEDHVWVTHTPTRLFNLDAMAHIPYIPEVKFLPRPGGKSNLCELQLPVVIKSRANPETATKHVQYISDVRTFLTYNPEFNGRQF